VAEGNEKRKEGMRDLVDEAIRVISLTQGKRITFKP
jgi:hypothetical protein